MNGTSSMSDQQPDALASDRKPASDQASTASSSHGAAPTAGALLRQARESQGLHIAALAASLKVSPRKLEALERDRYAELPDPAFTRALAQTMCRALKIEAGPVMALLPRVDSSKLDEALAGLNTPFRERPTQGEPELASVFSNPVAWVVALLLLAALAVYFWPGDESPGPAAESAPTVSVPDGLALPAPTDPVLQPSLPDVAAAAAASEPAVEPVPAVSAALPAPVSRLVAVRVTAGSWVSVTDADGRSLLARTVEPGETVALDGALPLQVTVGNASATELMFRGEPVDLTPHLSGNVARLQLR